MKLLIDTQVFIWLINDDKRLGNSALQALTNPSNEVSISYFSFFEMIIKASVGKLEYNPTIIDDLPKMGIELLLPDKDSLKNYMILNPCNKDPFDNALLTVSRNEKCIFVTSDPKILAVSFSGLEMLDALK